MSGSVLYGKTQLDKQWVIVLVMKTVLMCQPYKIGTFQTDTDRRQRMHWLVSENVTKGLMESNPAFSLGMWFYIC